MKIRPLLTLKRRGQPGNRNTRRLAQMMKQRKLYIEIHIIMRGRAILPAHHCLRADGKDLAGG
ncbi:MAG: hypothetical protein LC799_02810 [Actinobacteria bacterium]|nr:hypothetical protein [Actinomycetota bacterium]